MLDSIDVRRQILPIVPTTVTKSRGSRFRIHELCEQELTNEVSSENDCPDRFGSDLVRVINDAVACTNQHGSTAEWQSDHRDNQWYHYGQAARRHQ